LSATTGGFNVAVGTLALDALTTGVDNVAIGHDCLTTNVAGDNVVAIGPEAAKRLNPSGNVDMNGVYIGVQAGDEVTTGPHNTVIGALTANALTTGSNNLLLGTTAGNASQPGGSISTGDNQIVLGNASSTNAHIQIDWTVASDERDKTDFTALDLGLDFVKELEPVTYKWDKRAKYGDDISTITHDGTHKEDWLDVGFKAQAVEALEEAAGYTIADKTNLTTNLTDDGKQYGLTYSKFVPILVKAIQELSEKVAALEAK
jgi:trimeric autotransporter adhesin